MKRISCFKPCLIALATFLAVASAYPQSQGRGKISVDVDQGPGNVKPTLVSVSGITGEALQVLHFDLYVQGFAFTNAESAQYQISGSANGNLQAGVIERVNQNPIVRTRAYSGVALRQQVHAFSDDFVNALVASGAREAKGIARTRILFKGETGRKSELYLADFDGQNAQPITSDNSLVVAPCMVPGRLAVYYTSYRLGDHPDIYFQDLSAGSRRIIARYGGSNMSPAASPDGRHVAMVLSKDGWTDLYVANADGTGLRRLTKSPQDESSPCWSPDSQKICFASKEGERRRLSIISANGGQPQVLSLGVGNPTEPDWSPDGKYIAFASQAGGSFTICVYDVEKGGPAVRLAEGEDPSWAANSRTLVCARRAGGKGNYTLSLLDVMTKQAKDVSRISGISSQSQPSWAK